MKFKVGDVCITQGSRHPLLNDNQLVVVESIDAECISVRGERAPYTIRRLDGKAHPSTSHPTTGQQCWYKSMTAICPERMLRKPSEDELATNRTAELECQS